MEVLGLLLFIFGMFCSLALIVLYVVLACCFANYAAQKGHSNDLFFWVCLLLGTTGYLMVAALPDRTLHKQLDRIATSLPMNNATWVCAHCETENSVNYGQCKKCGKNRS